jgi:hypothetical protein
LASPGSATNRHVVSDRSLLTLALRGEKFYKSSTTSVDDGDGRDTSCQELFLPPGSDTSHLESVSPGEMPMESYVGAHFYLCYR